MTTATSYGRMFPHLPTLPATERMLLALQELGRSMRDDEDEGEGPLNAAFAGYTYFGQFIDHDLTWDPSPIEKVATAAEQTRNLRNGLLDLDVLYAGGPAVAPFLYDRHSKHGQEQLLIGETRPASELETSPDDLPRNPQGTALVPDPRQDDNLIIAQLHVAFAKLHNRVITSPAVLDASPYYRAAGSTFDAARRAVTWHYQWLVRHDFLKELINEEVYDALDDLQPRAAQPRSGGLKIPVEFALAAFRFGHSMVRNTYKYNASHPEVDLRDDLARQTGRGGGAVPALSAEWKIVWEKFFGFSGSDPQANRARRIDTKLAGGLFRLPPDGRDLAVMTLTRGARAGLPSGQMVARHYGVKPLTPDEIGSTLEPSLKAEFRFETETPLWYYILHEAKLRGSGEELGPVGSRIVADVVVAALQADSGSYLNVAPRWQPTFGDSEDASSYKMTDLLRFILEG